MASAAHLSIAESSAPDPAVISTDGLHKRYGTLQVLKGIDFRAEDGEVVSILGASGSGKSTFLRCLNLLKMPSAGQIRIFGEEVKLRKAGSGLRIADRRQVDRLRTQVAMVFQNFWLWSHMTVLENLMEAPVHVQRRNRAEVRDEAEAVLKRVGLLDRMKSYPAQLSGGQQQRAAIARALVMKPRVYYSTNPRRPWTLSWLARSSRSCATLRQREEPCWSSRMKWPSLETCRAASCFSKRGR